MSTARPKPCSTELTPEMRYELIELFSRQDVKDFILKVLITNVRSVIEMTRRVLRTNPLYNEALLKYDIFVWDIVRFLHRMNPVEHVNVLHLEETETIVLTKIMTDLYCLDYYLGMIEQRQLEAVHHQLRGCQHLLTIHEDLKVKYRQNLALQHDYMEEDEFFSVEKAAANTTKAFEFDQAFRRCIDQNVRLPIRSRYVHNYQETHMEAVEHLASYREQKVREQIYFYRREMFNINQATLSAVQYHKLQIQDCMNKIEFWSWKYEHEYEKVNSKTMYYQAATKAIKRQRQRCAERIAALLQCLAEMMLIEKKKKKRQRRKYLEEMKKNEENELAMKARKRTPKATKKKK